MRDIREVKYDFDKNMKRLLLKYSLYIRNPNLPD